MYSLFALHSPTWICSYLFKIQQSFINVLLLSFSGKLLQHETNLIKFFSGTKFIAGIWFKSFPTPTWKGYKFCQSPWKVSRVNLYGVIHNAKIYAYVCIRVGPVIRQCRIYPAGFGICRISGMADFQAKYAGLSSKVCRLSGIRQLKNIRIQQPDFGW